MDALEPMLVDPLELAERLGEPSLRIIETTVHLRRPAGVSRYTIVSGRPDYERAHVPGAAFVDLPGALSDTASPLPNTLLDQATFAKRIGCFGVGPSRRVVVYSQSSVMWATRLWWILRYYGFDRVSVLDGGLDGWRSAGLPLESGSSSYPPASFEPARRDELMATRTAVEATVNGKTDACLLNALSAATFRGSDQGSATRPGRIPGSANVHWQGLVDAESGRFRPAAELREIFDRAGALTGPPSIAYCGGGIAATVAIFALALAGRDDARLYDGSLNEWSADPALPLEVC